MAKISREADEPVAKPAYRMPTLEAERVTLRPLRTDDVYAIFGFFSDPEVTRYWSRPPMTHLAQARTLLRAMRDGNRTGLSPRVYPRLLAEGARYRVAETGQVVDRASAATGGVEIPFLMAPDVDILVLEPVPRADTNTPGRGDA